MTEAPRFGIGHNSGREVATPWRVHCWREARRALLPTLPLEVIRTRVARARELGLDYRTYAGVRASTGRDLVAFLFSSNALRLLRLADPLPDDRAEKLAALRDCARILVARPLRPVEPPLDAAAEAPAPFAPFRDTRMAILTALGRLPADGVLLVGDTALEREWSAAGRLAGYLPADRYFPAP